MRWRSSGEVGTTPRFQGHCPPSSGPLQCIGEENVVIHWGRKCVLAYCTKSSQWGPRASLMPFPTSLDLVAVSNLHQRCVARRWNGYAVFLHAARRPTRLPALGADVAPSEIWGARLERVLHAMGLSSGLSSSCSECECEVRGDVKQARVPVACCMPVCGWMSPHVLTCSGWMPWFSRPR